MTSRGHPRPIIHGRDHKGPDADGNPGGTDPSHLNVDSTDNVGLLQGVRSAGVGSDGYLLNSLADGGSIWLPGPLTPSYRDVVTGAQYASCLLGYWRLGDTSGNFLDTNPYLSALDLSVVSGTNALTRAVTGGLSSNQDDGAVRFNGNGNPAVSGGHSGDYLHVTTSRFDFSGSGTVFTVAVWIKPLTYPTSPDGWNLGWGIVTSQAVGALNERGWALKCIPGPHASPALVSFVKRGDGAFSDTGVTAPITMDTWNHIVAVYDTIVGFSIYVDGVLASGTSPAGFSVPGSGGIEVGRATTNSLAGGTGHDHFYGAIDEVAIFGCALTADQAAELFAAGEITNAAGDFTVYVNGS